MKYFKVTLEAVAGTRSEAVQQAIHAASLLINPNANDISTGSTSGAASAKVEELEDEE